MNDPTKTLDVASIEDYRFDEACETLTAMLNDLNPNSNTYTSRGQNVGWRNTSGTTEVTLSDGRDLLRKITPNADWTLSATLDDDCISLKISHHDSPTGETHVLTPA